MNRSAYLIYNPVAGQGDSEAELAKIEELLSSKIDLNVQFTSEVISANLLARGALEQNARMIIASGGDGTVSQVAEALVNTGVPLGIIARGTANAFAKALGIPVNIDEACETILTGATRTIDTGLCNDKPMVLLTGIGFEAETVDDTEGQFKERLGMMAYVVSGVKQLRNFPQFEAHIETVEETITVNATAITVANTAPNTSILAHGPAGIIPDDGLLDITVVYPENWAGAIAASYNLMKNALKDEPVDREDISYLRAKSIKVTTNPPQKLVLDGEVIGKEEIVTVKCLPHSLKVFVPETL
ncbi:YegS/Rv2252/BmrU family lipid kinase [Myxosarcina sp. GI1]|uniref:YegS/Rv2252/BmrU family lipid kinase n=1 Tax=Myxosarcina sp. GI1 TaxID=1541065 RepID=UPI00068D7FDC|nr:YegS/Rv2252/BmrU family lipid kinase [Myxosarcina sp. GI1]